MLCRRCAFLAAKSILPLIRSRSLFFLSPLDRHLLSTSRAQFSVPLSNPHSQRFLGDSPKENVQCSESEACAPAGSYWTSEPDVPVKLRLDRDHEANLEPTLTVPAWFTDTVAEHGDAPAMTVYREGAITTWTYQEYLEDVRAAAKGFIHLGLEPFHSVAILGFNSPEWLISDLGAIFAGGVSVGVYTTNTPEACRFVAKAARTNIVVAEDDAQIRKILKYRSELPHLKAIIQYIGEPDRRIENIYSWAEFMALGDHVTDEDLEERQKAIAPNKCCTVIFTSGTTGVPKGAMLSHDNLIWTAKTTIRDVEIEGEQTFVSYLPLSHVAAHLTEVYLPITTAGHVHFAQANALKDKGSLANTLRTAKPTNLVGVPRVWEKMQEEIEHATEKNVLLKMVFERAQKVGLQAFRNKQEG